MSIIIFIVILLFLIVVHEWGHFITAKKAGIRVDEFGIGFPPRAWTFFRKNGTDYTLNWLPFGGFVKIFGEDPQDVPPEHPDRARSLISKPWYVQALVLVAGVGMNVIAAWLLFAIAFMVGVPAAQDAVARPVTDPALTILQVLPESPAADVGLMSGDKILSVRSETNEASELSPEGVISFVETVGTTPLTVEFARGEERQSINITPKTGIVADAPERAVLGISMGVVGELKLPVHLALYEAGIQTVEYFGLITVSLLSFFAQAFTFNADLSQVSGPVGIVGLVGDAAQFGVVSLIMFTAIISLHLAVINLLPVPALDGGRLLFVIIEAIKGSPIKPVVAQTANTIGFVFLIFLMVVVTVSDVVKLFI